jgi:hypothetical protein
MVRMLLTTIACLLFAAHFAVASAPDCGGAQREIAGQAFTCFDMTGQGESANPFANADHAKPCHDHIGDLWRTAAPIVHARSPLVLATAAPDINPVPQDIVLPPPQ